MLTTAASMSSPSTPQRMSRKYESGRISSPIARTGKEFKSDKPLEVVTNAGATSTEAQGSMNEARGEAHNLDAENQRIEGKPSNKHKSSLPRQLKSFLGLKDYLEPKSRDNETNVKTEGNDEKFFEAEDSATSENRKRPLTQGLSSFLSGFLRNTARSQDSPSIQSKSRPPLQPQPSFVSRKLDKSSQNDADNSEVTRLPQDDSNLHENRNHKILNLFRKTKKQGGPKGGALKNIDEELDDATGERAEHLLGGLLIGTPSINMIASRLLVDESGISRSSLLLTLIGFHITDISPSVYTKNRRLRIDLEYGVWSQRLKWAVERSAKDLLYLHSRFKIYNWKTELRKKNSELPKFPVPPIRKHKYHDNILHRKRDSARRSAESTQAQNDDDNNDNASVSRLTETSLDRRSVVELLGDQFSHLRANLSDASSLLSEELSPELLKLRQKRNEEYVQQVEKYLHNLIKFVALRPQSNRLFQFLEISPISSLLSCETGFIGKQGIVHVGGTSGSQGWRMSHLKANDLKKRIDRRADKWLLVRGSYIMYVSNINSTTPLEVFLVDPKFKIHFKGSKSDVKHATKEYELESDLEDDSIAQKELAKIGENVENEGEDKVFKHLKITLENSERQLTFIPRSYKERQLWIKSLVDMKASTEWSRSHPFNSFAPVRKNVLAQWFVDARDHFWAVSSALEMAKDVIYIHDWWLSPELYMRRPANGNQQWRLDRILQRKANQGVKIFVIIYRNVGNTVVTDSLYTKHSLLSLNDQNIHVIRSPNQLLQNTYFWSHHEKLCIVDHAVAFLGGIDLCYGRYDTCDHVLTDDSKQTFSNLDPYYSSSITELSKFQIFPGKDYSNPRVRDFYALDKPYDSMYDRNTVPRMPWHDVHMVTCGKIARDLSRHFVQRWNYLIRQKRPSRFTPLLIPPSDMTDSEVRQNGFEGTCDIQLLRSSGNWSLGLKNTEHSIQEAYLKLIETSEHFVYIENQFFVTSCFIDGNEIENKIGDALVDRIIRAFNEGAPWRAIIVIPLMPGYPSKVDEPDGSSVRVIMQCQYMSISRGPTSIFAKLRRCGIEPRDYIHFFSLRKWGRISPERTLVSEQLYIHAKTMIVDDRVAIIGSANINERSMRGSRDSEVAAVIRDKEIVMSRMNGESFEAGKFAFSLRQRLMREHLGVDIDALEIVERKFRKIEDFAYGSDGSDFATGDFHNKENAILSAMVEIATRQILNEHTGTEKWKKFRQKHHRDTSPKILRFMDIAEEEEERQHPLPISLPISFNNRTGIHEANKGIRDKKKISFDPRVQTNEDHFKDVSGEGIDMYKSKLGKRSRLNSARYLRDLANKTMRSDATIAFLPDVISVKAFLGCDDFDESEQLDEETEKITTEKNKERWMLLKRVAYLQRVAAKSKLDENEESNKRAAFGMDSNTLIGSSYSSFNNGRQDLENTLAPSSSAPKADSTRPSSVSSIHNTNDSKVEEHSDKDEFTSLHGIQVPVVSLDEQGVLDLIHSISSSSSSLSHFVDPYGFDDPVCEEFYDDVWYENARRNTEIFRLIFHVQPDDQVVSWKEYKEFGNLKQAFVSSQKREASNIRKFNHRYATSGDATDDSDSITDLGEDGYNQHGNVDRRYIDVKDGSNEELLGQLPLSGEVSGTLNESENNVLKGTKEDKPEHEGYVDASNGEDMNTHFQGAKHTLNKLNNDRNDYESSKPTEISYDPEILMNGRSYEKTPDNVSENNKRAKIRNRRSLGSRRKFYNGKTVFSHDTAERILKEIRGHIVTFPTEWLSRELDGGNWFYNTDRIPPIDIYD